MKSSWFVASSMFAAWAVACSSNSSGNLGGDAGAIAFEALPAKYAAALCAAYQNCVGPLFPLELNGSDCTQLTTQRLNNGTFSLVQQKITAGTIVYDGTKAQACLDAVSQLSCDGLLQRDPSACLAALDGVAALGADCDLNEECKGSAICQASSGTCPGKCVALLSAGQVCTQDSDCGDGLQCSSETKLCVKPASVGDACDYGAPPCGPGLICLGQNDTNKTSGVCYNAMTALSASDAAACNPSAGTLCKAGLSCVAESVDSTSSTVTWQCVPTGTYKAGDTCKPGFPEACASGNYCLTGTGLAALSGTCTPLPDAKQACGTGIGAQCKTGAVCVSGLCEDYAANGVSCTGDDMCYSQYCGSSNGCAPRVPCQ